MYTRTKEEEILSRASLYASIFICFDLHRSNSSSSIDHIAFTISHGVVHEAVDEHHPHDERVVDVGLHRQRQHVVSQRHAARRRLPLHLRHHGAGGAVDDPAPRLLLTSAAAAAAAVVHLVPHGAPAVVAAAAAAPELARRRRPAPPLEQDAAARPRHREPRPSCSCTGGSVSLPLAAAPFVPFPLAECKLLHAITMLTTHMPDQENTRNSCG
ncbi:Os07g0672566 [Oryza sativa Japonica Group]|uniref:Os07g0672566 protein n=1 Tax=Oryza sativa subsp. japonica TaxID=39947 RepID=A0A0P0XA61_ORYSJ|nr:Os07g0672566 [Oryza sativa Japonica Group]